MNDNSRSSIKYLTKLSRYKIGRRLDVHFSPKNLEIGSLVLFLWIKELRVHICLIRIYSNFLVNLTPEVEIKNTFLIQFLNFLSYLLQHR